MACGIQLSYDDMNGQTVRASRATLLACLRSLGVDIQRTADAPSALEKLLQKNNQRIVEPVILAWSGRLPGITLRLPVPLPGSIHASLVLETGKTRRYSWNELGNYLVDKHPGGDVGFGELRLPLAGRMPMGYHKLILILGKTRVSTLIIAAPKRVPSEFGKRWGLFSPVYALQSGSSGGTGGTFTDFSKLAKWTASAGGTVVATLPLLPAFYREHFNPSPYSPVSRLFWNEFFIDLQSVPELEHCLEARNLLSSLEYQAEQSRLSAEPLVDYASQMELKRRILELLTNYFFRQPQTAMRRQVFDRYLAGRPDLEDYARFRAVSEDLKTPWPEWRQGLKQGQIRESECRLETRNYYLYTQFIAHEQMALAASTASERGQSFYLDLPLGANSYGYDVWKNQPIFALGSSVGAPPDPAFPGGQDWGFPPLHPERLRESGYRYFIDVVRHHLRFSGLLRLDHIMGLHRLYWVPAGAKPNEGIYVRYQAEEMYAILCLESHRSGAVIVGEDLGLVPEPVRWAMRRHNIDRSYVAQ